jgi:chemotaxis protein histidine kinase CheA
MDPEQEKYRELFSLDANDQLETIRQMLPKWEVEPGSADLVKNLHRAFHSLKGLSATMGFSDIFALAQKMVVLYDKIRVGLEKKMDVNKILKPADFGGEGMSASDSTSLVCQVADLSRQSLKELEKLVREHSRSGN